MVPAARFDDLRSATLWVLWAVLFTSFFLLLALERERLRPLVGWITVIEPVVTGSIPASLMLLGARDDVPEWTWSAPVGSRSCRSC